MKASHALAFRISISTLGTRSAELLIHYQDQMFENTKTLLVSGFQLLLVATSTIVSGRAVNGSQ